MQISKVNFQITGWMLNELDLKGNELLIYAIIYAYSQFDDQYFTCCVQDLADLTHISRGTVLAVLKNLTKKGFLSIKREKIVKRVKFYSIKAIRNV